MVRISGLSLLRDVKLIRYNYIHIHPDYQKKFMDVARKWLLYDESGHIKYGCQIVLSMHDVKVFLNENKPGKKTWFAQFAIVPSDSTDKPAIPLPDEVDLALVKVRIPPHHFVFQCGDHLSEYGDWFVDGLTIRCKKCGSILYPYVDEDGYIIPPEMYCLRKKDGKLLPPLNTPVLQTVLNPLASTEVLI